ncbi:MAG: hypothetical protein RLN83_09200 [Balneola sp.]
MPVGLKSSLVNWILNVDGGVDLVRYTSQGFIPQRYEYRLRILLRFGVVRTKVLSGELDSEC